MRLGGGTVRGALRAVAISCVALGARAETLEDAWSAALADNPSVRAAESLGDAADAELEAARAQRRPTVAATTSVSRWRDTPAFDFGAIGVPATLPLFPGDSLTVGTAQISMPIYTAGQIKSNVAAATASVTARERSTATLVEDVKLAVASAYVDVLRAASGLTAAEATVASLAAHARDVEVMERNGQVPRNDGLAAAVSLADAEQRRLAAENALDVARASYNRRLGRALSTPVELEPVVRSLQSIEARGIDDLISTALATRAELAGLDAVAAGYEAQAAAKRAERLPQLTLSGGYTYLENSVLDREDFWSIGVGLRWNLFDAGRTSSASAALTQRSSAAKHERDDLRASIELDVRRAWLTLGETRARLGVAEQAIAQADENLRVVNDRYRNGEGTNTEVLDAETLRSLSRRNFDDSRYDAIVAELTLARAVGVL
jgi:outer membrane protein TolC